MPDCHRCNLRLKETECTPSTTVLRCVSSGTMSANWRFVSLLNILCPSILHTRAITCRSEFWGETDGVCDVAGRDKNDGVDDTDAANLTIQTLFSPGWILWISAFFFSLL